MENGEWRRPRGTRGPPALAPVPPGSRRTHGARGVGLKVVGCHQRSPAVPPSPLGPPAPPALPPSSPALPPSSPRLTPPTSHASFDAGGLLVWTGLWRSQNGRPKGLSSPTSTPDPASRSVFLCSSDYIPIKDQRPFNWSDPPLIGTRPLSYLPSHRPLGFLGVLALAAIISTGISDDNVPRPSPVPVPWSSSSSKIATNNIAFFLSSPAPDSDASRIAGHLLAQIHLRGLLSASGLAPYLPCLFWVMSVSTPFPSPVLA